MAELNRDLHFTLGPVQGFVAQARRTRDLWAGSFLLSYLSGQAMAAVLRDGGEIVFPYVADDQLLKAIRDGGVGPKVGSLPNRFKARVSTEFSPAKCREAVKMAWVKVADAVWDEYLSKITPIGNCTHEIWQRQVDHFWEIAWCIGAGDDLLDRRKNWRTTVPTSEPGDKCTMMGGWQELSGFERARGKRKEQDAFWDKRRAKVGKLNLRDGERLCAIALIKRLYPLVAKQAIGWEVPINFASTAYVAAVPWIVRSLENNTDKATKFGEVAREIGDQSSRMVVDDFPSAKKAVAGDYDRKTFASLGGEYFHRVTLEDGKRWQDDTDSTRKKLRSMLDEDTLGEPSSFYAMLLMDGDRLGKLLQNNDGAEISRALASFTGRVREITEKHDGVVVYAGGDDVLGLFSLGKALEAAADLQLAYREAFSATVVAGKAHISAAIIYANFHHPLQGVFTKAHNLLADIAKEKTGRDSLAITVWKGSGEALTWSAPWENGAVEKRLADLVSEFSDDKYSTGFFYHIRERFALLESEAHGLDPVRLLTAEYMKNRDKREGTVKDAEGMVRKLLEVCKNKKRDQETGVVSETKGVSVEGALLVRFLAKGGEER